LELREVTKFVDNFRHYVSRRAVLLNAWEFMICEQAAAVISSISQLFPVTVGEQCGMSWCGMG
jgi:hypothetical protein